MTSAGPSVEPAPADVSSRSHLPSLDGVRAISIVLVLLGHLNGTRGFPKIPERLGDIAHLGVVIFFVISGFLITTLLISERLRYGRVSLSKFYARRALRIFPASYAFIGIAVLLYVAGMFELRSADVWHAVTYTVNYERFRSWQVGHLWSLSVEEQFYFLWPLAFVAFSAAGGIRVAIAVLLLGPIARAVAWMLFRDTPYAYLEFFPKVADSLAAGCLLALLRPWLETRAWYLRLFRVVPSLAVAGLILVLAANTNTTIIGVAGMSLVNLGLAILIHRSVYCSKDWVGRILNWRPVALIGTLSYSLYLWQEIFLNRYSSAWPNRFPQNSLLAILTALASYLLLERPLLRVRHRLRSSG